MSLNNQISIFFIVTLSCVIHSQAQSSSADIAPSTPVVNPVVSTPDLQSTPLAGTITVPAVQPTSAQSTSSSTSASMPEVSDSAGIPGTQTLGVSIEPSSAEGSQTDTTAGGQVDSTDGVQATSSGAGGGQVDSTDAVQSTSSGAGGGQVDSTNAVQATPSGTRSDVLSETSNAPGSTAGIQPSETSSSATSSSSSAASGIQSTPALGSSTSTSAVSSASGGVVPSGVPSMSATATSQPSSSVAPSASMTSSVTGNTPPPTSPAISTQPPVSTKFPSFAGDVDIALYTLKLSFKTAAVSESCNSSSLHNEVLQKLTGTEGFVTLKDVAEIQFDAVYRAREIQGLAENTTINNLKDALSNKPKCYNYTDSAFQESLATFAALTTSYCSAMYICKAGYQCQLVNSNPLCTSVCENKQCQNNGVCNVLIDKDGKASTSCSCVSNYETTYSGDNCQTARMNPERVAAIVGGVLGAVCFILLVALYCMCYRKRNSSGKKYQLSGVYNDTYDHADLNMKNL